MHRVVSLAVAVGLVGCMLRAMLKKKGSTNAIKRRWRHSRRNRRCHRAISENI